MTARDVEFVPATRDLVTAFYGYVPQPTIQAHVAVLDGRVVGVAGIAFESGGPMLFSDPAPEMRARRRDMVRAVRFLEAQAKGFKGRLFAIAKVGEPAAPRLLKRLGFVPVEGERAEGVLMVRLFP